MTRRLLSALAVALLMTAPLSHASGWGLGTDVIRILDRNQDPDGLFNLFMQVPAGYSGGLVLGYSSGDRLNIAEVGYKHYPGSVMNGAFFQAGAGWYDTDEDDEFGMVGKIGYEHRLARHFVVTGAVRAVVGVDEAIIGQPETPVYQPMLGFMLAF